MRKKLDSLLSEKIIILDGATGTNLQKCGMPGNVCPEKWIMDHPEPLKQLQRAYAAAGCDIVYAPTFSANRIKLKEYGLEDQVEEINRCLVRISRDAVGEDIMVAGDMTMTGEQLEPIGDLTFDELLLCYEEQARAIAEAGADIFVVETMMNLQETRAAVLAIQKVCTIPIMVTMTFDANGRTLYGTDGITALITFQSMGVAAFGMNCSCGPKNMEPMLEAMKPYARIPLIVKANAGLPEYVNGETVFSMGPEEFSRETAGLITRGAAMAGGCCGTTPEHIRSLALAASGMPCLGQAPAEAEAKTAYAVTTQRKTWFLDPDMFAKGILENVRINTMLNAMENDDFYRDLQSGQWDALYDIMEDIADDMPDLIQVCVDADGIDGVRAMKTLFNEMDLSIAPVAISSVHPETLEAALTYYPGRALVLDISQDDHVKAAIMAVCKQYGAVMLENKI